MHLGELSMPRFASIATRLLPVLVSLALMAVAGPASANRLQLKDMIAQTAVQRTMVWTLGADIMRLALKIDEQGAAGRLRHSHGQFGPSLEFLRQGVSELRDRDVTNAEAMFVAITDVTRNWAAMDEALQPVWTAGTVTVAQARELLDLDRRLGQSIEQILAHLEQASNHYGAVTVIGRAITTTERGRALGQRIAAEAMAVTLDFDVGDSDPLGETVAQFEGLLRALQNGDPERGLIPPPTVDLRRKLFEVEVVWQQMTPHLATAVAGDPLTRASADNFALSSAHLFAELGMVAELLADLVPGGSRNVIRSRGPAPDDQKLL